MKPRISMPLLSLLSLAVVVPSTLAAPTRTHCRCTIVDANTVPSSDLPLPDTSRPPDICTDLGPELEHFRHSEPELYHAYLNEHNAAQQARPTPTEEDMRPLTTTVMMKLAAKNGLNVKGAIVPSAPLQRPEQRIVCHSVSEVPSAYHDSQTTLLLLQVIVALAILGCIAECISLLTDWLERREQEHRYIHLSGAERRLRARSAPENLSVVSEKLRISPVTPYLLRADEGIHDDDDELNRPVL